MQQVLEKLLLEPLEFLLIISNGFDKYLKKKTKLFSPQSLISFTQKNSHTIYWLPGKVNALRKLELLLIGRKHIH